MSSFRGRTRQGQRTSSAEHAHLRFTALPTPPTQRESDYPIKGRFGYVNSVGQTDKADKGFMRARSPWTGQLSVVKEVKPSVVALIGLILQRLGVQHPPYSYYST